MDRARQKRSARLTVNFMPREDGGLRAYSDDIPELVLSHANAQAVLDDVEPALAMILSAKLGYRVKVSPLVGLREALDDAREALADAGVVFDERPDPRKAREYVAYVG